MKYAIPFVLAGLILSTAVSAAPLFESNGTPLQYANQVDKIRDAGGFVPTAQPELSIGGLPGDWGDYWIPTHSGVNAIRFAGASTGPDALCAMLAYTVHIRVDKKTILDYWLFPQQENAEYAGIDLHCTDGTLLSETKAVDQNGKPVDPASGHGGIPVLTWSEVRSTIGKWLAGKTIDKVLVTYRRTNGSPGVFRGYVDAIVITDDQLSEPSAIAGAKALQPPDGIKNGTIYCVSERQFSESGDLKGVDAGLGRLCELGISTVWLMPINTIGSLKAIGSPYCVRDYYGIDPKMGTAADLHTLVADAHLRKMAVILDVALNHTSWDNELITKHPEWYRHNSGDVHDPSTVSHMPWWNDIAQLDYSQQGLRDYMVDMLKYWLKTYDLDGFRFDTGEFLPTEFWNQASTALRKVKPDVILLGESHRPDMMVDGVNVDYSFTLVGAMQRVLHGKAPASLIKQAWNEEHASYPAGAVHMRYIGNQDTDKPAKEFGVGAAHAAAVLMFTLDGVPMVYNGQEVDDTTSGHFLDRGKINWGDGRHYPWTYSLTSQLIGLRSKSAELVDGDVEWVSNDHPDQLLTFVRKKGKRETFVAVNLSDKPLDGSVLPVNRATIISAYPTGAQTDEDDWRLGWRDESPSNWVGRGVPPSTFDNKPYGYSIMQRETK